MRFENFIQALDMGQCKDQLQRQALFDIALMFVMIDGEIDAREEAYMEKWLAKLTWLADMDKRDYYEGLKDKIEVAIANDDVEDYLAHRCAILLDPWMREQALQLADDIAKADDNLDDKEQAALDFLLARLEDKR